MSASSIEAKVSRDGTAPPNPTEAVRTPAQAIAAAVAYLLGCQTRHGCWTDYRLPVGASDAWITGYVGLALANSAVSDLVFPACLRAAKWLKETRPYLAGWGYNGHTGADADSTAFAIRFLDKVGVEAPDSDRDWLLSCFRQDGGFVTYPRNDAWGGTYCDVTASAFLALSASAREQAGAFVAEFLNRQRNKNGTWPSYWWRTCHYATYLCLQVMKELGRTRLDGLAPVVSSIETDAIHGAFDLALVLGIADLRGAPQTLRTQLINLLLRQQRPDGAWAGGPNLRVTDPGCTTPWLKPKGRLYTDTNHLITTATALHILAAHTD